jgi:hypothetical protein
MDNPPTAPRVVTLSDCDAIRVSGHRIVAAAFHGPGPSSEYVVDHIDTNRQNNRPDNLRWVTRLESILLNPITLARIEFAYGSLDAFFANPGAAQVPNWEWMRTVTKEEAQQCKKRLLGWAKKGQVRKRGSSASGSSSSRRSRLSLRFQDRCRATDHR